MANNGGQAHYIVDDAVRWVTGWPWRAVPMTDISSMFGKDAVGNSSEAHAQWSKIVD